MLALSNIQPINRKHTFLLCCTILSTPGAPCGRGALPSSLSCGASLGWDGAICLESHVDHARMWNGRPCACLWPPRSAVSQSFSPAICLMNHTHTKHTSQTSHSALMHSTNTQNSTSMSFTLAHLLWLQSL